VEEDLATKQTELELNHPMNHDVIRQYETRAAQVCKYLLYSPLETYQTFAAV